MVRPTRSQGMLQFLTTKIFISVPGSCTIWLAISSSLILMFYSLIHIAINSILSKKILTNFDMVFTLFDTTCVLCFLLQPLPSVEPPVKILYFTLNCWRLQNLCAMSGSIMLSLPDPYLMRPHLGSVGRNYGYFIQYTPDAGWATSFQIFVFMNDSNSASMTNDSSR